MRVLQIVLLSCVTMCLAGCFTIDEAASPGHKDNLVVGNYGWYVFGTVPLVCGDAEAEPRSGFVFFRDDVTHAKIQSRFMEASSRHAGKSVVNLVWKTEEQVLFSIPGIQIPVSVPYLVVYREHQLSGELR